MIDLTKPGNELLCALGIDGLAAIVTQYGETSGGQLVSVLWTEDRPDQSTVLAGDGYVLLYKRLSNGRFQWPRTRRHVGEFRIQLKVFSG